MNHYPSNVKEKLNSIILSMAEHHWLFSKNPGHDFTRQHLGKLSFYDTMRLIISMGKGSTNDEIMDYFDLDPDLLPTPLPAGTPIGTAAPETLSLHSLLSASAADRFPSLLLNTFFRNSHLLFHPLPTNSKTIVFSPAMGATLSMLPILILSRTIISPGLSTIKVTTTCT